MLLNSPLVSVIIPNFNRGLLIPETLNSLLKQTYGNWEGIVVDDGSTDNSVAVIEDFTKKDERFRLIKRTRLPKGAPCCRNIGFENAKGDYVIFLDSDDILASYCLESRLNYFSINRPCDFLVFPMLIFEKQIGDSDILWNINNNDEDDLYRFLKADPVWQTSGPIWKRSSVEKIGGWDEDAVSWQDWEFYVKALSFNLRYKKIETLPDCFLRRDENERISKEDAKPDHLYSRFKIFLKALSHLQTHNKLSKVNKRSLSILFFSHANKSAVRYYKEPLASMYARVISEYSLLSGLSKHLPLLYVNLLVTVKRLRLPFISTILFNLVKFLLPKYLFEPYDSVFKNHISEVALDSVKNNYD